MWRCLSENHRRINNQKVFINHISNNMDVSEITIFFEHTKTAYVRVIGNTIVQTLNANNATVWKVLPMNTNAPAPKENTINSLDETGMAALHKMALSGDIAKLDALLADPDIDPNVLSRDGLSPLHYVALGTAERLTEYISKILDSSTSSDTDVISELELINKGEHSIFKLSATIAKKILSLNGADPNIQLAGMTPLHLAANSGNLLLVKALIDAGADVDATTYANETPLHMAALIGHVNLGAYLVSLGADFNVENQQSKTPEDVASDAGYKSYRDDVEKLVASSTKTPKDEQEIEDKQAPPEEDEQEIEDKQAPPEKDEQEIEDKEAPPEKDEQEIEDKEAPPEEQTSPKEETSTPVEPKPEEETSTPVEPKPEEETSTPVEPKPEEETPPRDPRFLVVNHMATDISIMCDTTPITLSPNQTASCYDNVSVPQWKWHGRGTRFDDNSFSEGLKNWCFDKMQMRIVSYLRIRTRCLGRHR